MRRALAIGLVLIVGGLSAGCGGGDSGPGGQGGSAGAGGGAGGSGGGSNTLACTGQPSGVNLGGVWAARGKLAVTLKGKPGGAITTCPAGQVGESDLLLLLDIHADASDPKKLDMIKATLCSIELPTVTALVGDCTAHPDNLVSTQLIAPKRFIDALPAVATQPVTGKLSSDAAGADLAMDRFTVTVGSNKSGSSLPKWNTDDGACNAASLGHQSNCETTCVDDCAGMRDDDHDGFPGVTLQVCGKTDGDVMTKVKCNADAPDMPGVTLQGKAFLDIQVDPQFTGKALSSCEISGQVDTSVLYNLVGGDIYLTGAPITVSSAINSLPEFHVEVDQSKFRMIRVDGKYATDDWKADPSDPQAACAAVIAHQSDPSF